MKMSVTDERNSPLSARRARLSTLPRKENDVLEALSEQTLEPPSGFFLRASFVDAPGGKRIPSRSA